MCVQQALGHDSVLACAVQVQLLQRDAELAEAMSTSESSTTAWRQEQQRLQNALEKWREKALEMQEEVRNL